MEKGKSVTAAFSALSTRAKAVLLAAAILLVVLAAALCISSSMRTNIQHDYTAVRNKTGEALYSNLSMLAQTFDMTAVPGADVQSAILPQMKEYFIASKTLNGLLAQAYGPKYAVLSDGDIDSLTGAFAAYDAALRNGSPTDLALSDLQLWMDRIRELLSSRFSQGSLKAAR